MPARHLAQPLLVLHAEGDLAESGAVDDGAAAAELARLVEHIRDRGGRNPDNHRVGHVGKL